MKQKKRWMKENTVVKTVKFNRNTDQRYLDYLEGKATATEIKRGLDLLIAMEKEQED